MNRITGEYRTTTAGGETVRAFFPFPLPPRDPPLVLDDETRQLLRTAEAAIGRLAVAGLMVPSPDWFLYGYVRKEAVLSSQIEGTQATLQDVLAFEATQQADRRRDVEDVCNYVDALTYARNQIARSAGLPLSTRLLCAAHKRLMKGVRGADKEPGAIRRSQNWIGGSRPGNASFVPPPADQVATAMSALDQWIHADDPLPPLIRIGLAHVQFETIHPFLDGNGRIGRLLITLLVEHWGLLQSPLLYLSVAIKRRQAEYYRLLSAVRTDGDWEGWTKFFLQCVAVAADDGVITAQRVFSLTGKDRERLLTQKKTTIPAVRLFDELARHPFVTLPLAMNLLETTKPTALKAIDALVRAGILHETTGKERDRVFAYHSYLQVLTRDT
jgi:Fic family protein